jgi:hypothetical protein
MKRALGLIAALIWAVCITISLWFASGCAMVEYGSHSLSSSPFPELPGLNEASNGYRPAHVRPESGDAYHGRRPLDPDEELCCRGWRACHYYNDPWRPHIKITKTSYSDEHCSKRREAAHVDSRQEAKAFCRAQGGVPDPDMYGENCHRRRL